MADNRDPSKPRGLLPYGPDPSKPRGLPCQPMNPNDPDYVKLERLPQNVTNPRGKFKIRPAPTSNNALAPASALASTLAPTLAPLPSIRAPTLGSTLAPALPSIRAPALVSSLAPPLAPAPEGQATRRLLPFKALPLIVDPDDSGSRFQLMYDVYLNSSAKTPYTLDGGCLARKLEAMRMAARSRIHEAIQRRTNRLLNNIQATKLLSSVKRSNASRVPFINMIDFSGEELITEIQQMLILKFDRLLLRGMSAGETVLEEGDIEYILRAMYTNATRKSTSSLIRWCCKFSKKLDKIRSCSEYSQRDIDVFDRIIQILLENCSTLLAQMAGTAAKAARRKIERNFFVAPDEQDGGADAPPVEMEKVPRGDTDAVDGKEEEAKTSDNTLQPAQVEDAQQDITASAPPPEKLEDVEQDLAASAPSENIQEIDQGITAPPSENIEETDQDITAQQPRKVEEVDQDIAEPTSGNVDQVNHDISSLPSENAVVNGDVTTPPAETAIEAKQDITEVCT